MGVGEAGCTVGAVLASHFFAAACLSLVLFGIWGWSSGYVSFYKGILGPDCIGRIERYVQAVCC